MARHETTSSKPDPTTVANIENSSQAEDQDQYGGGSAGATPGRIAGPSMVLQGTSTIDLTVLDNHYFTWNIAFDNTFDFNELVDGVPDGMGLTVALDGSSPNHHFTETGVWDFTLTARMKGLPDSALKGFLGIFSGTVGDWQYGPGVNGDTLGHTQVNWGATAYIPAGKTVQAGTSVVIAATTPGVALDQSTLAIVRLA